MQAHQLLGCKIALLVPVHIRDVPRLQFHQGKHITVTVSGNAMEETRVEHACPSQIMYMVVY